MHLEQRLEFIDSLPSLPKSTIRALANTPDSAPIDPSKSSGTIGPDMVNIYIPGVSEQNRTDVDYCKLLLQNAANKMFHPTEQMYEWYKYYTDSLATVGWITQSSQEKRVTINKTALTMDAVALEILQGFIGTNAPKLLQMAGKAINTVKNDQGLVTIFERNKTTGHEARFDISPVWQTAEGNPMMVMSCSSIDVRESKRGVLWWKSTSQSTVVKSGAHAAYLNLNLYNELRSEIKAKVIGKSKEFLGTIPDL